MTPNYTCRICLTKNENSKKMKMLDRDLVQRIEELIGIEIKQQEGYPNRICSKCLEMLEISTKFRALCLSSVNALQNHGVKTYVKSEPMDTYENDDNHSIKSDHFFGEFVEGHEIEDISEIADFSMDGMPVKIKLNESKDDDDFERIGLSESESIASLVKDKTGKPREKGKTKTQKTTDEETPRFPSKRGRKKTEETGGSGTIMCEICGNIYKQRNLLNMHMRRHLEYKPYQCEICSKSFACPSEIRRHMRCHTGEKPYQCKFCGRSFADRSTNIKHERTHTNTRPFQCNTCGKSFSYSNVLKNHMLTHTGEKNFLCLPCNKTFSRKHQLDQHYATITHQQTLKCIENIDETQIVGDSEIIINNVGPLLLMPKVVQE